MTQISPRWAVNIIHTCLGVQPGEKVLIAVDEPLGYARDALQVEALKADPAELWTYTIHIAIGSNEFFGGQNPAPVHLDGVIGQPTLRVDGDLLIEEGRYLLHN